MNYASKLRKAIASHKLIIAPGAPDALTAKIIQKIGFDAVYMTGLGATASRLGQPDLGLLTQSEMADCARNMVRAVDIPVIADADTGYGGALNIRRTILEYAQAGVSAMHLEDQISPKRCGQLSGVKLVDCDQAVNRLSAAVEARQNNDMLIIGRTDALPCLGMDEAVSRAAKYLNTGIDLVFVDGVKTRQEVEEIANRLQGNKVLSIVDGTDAANLSFSDIQELGFSVVLYAVTSLFASVRASFDALESLKNAQKPAAGQSVSYGEFCEIVDLGRHHDFAERHGE